MSSAESQVSDLGSMRNCPSSKEKIRGSSVILSREGGMMVSRLGSDSKEYTKRVVKENV